MKNRLGANRSRRTDSRRIGSRRNRLATNRLARQRPRDRSRRRRTICSRTGTDATCTATSSAAPSRGHHARSTISPARPTRRRSPYTCAGGLCSFAGSVGLAPRVAEPASSSARARSGSARACSRAVNAHDTAEAISLRGTHRRTRRRAPTRPRSTRVEEGAFYGKSRSATTTPPVTATTIGDHDTSAAGDRVGVVCRWRDVRRGEPREPGGPRARTAP